nr:putative ribonuclease H-like domain-containing protein [Tanacetum cinerariifolium]
TYVGVDGADVDGILVEGCLSCGFEHALKNSSYKGPNKRSSSCCDGTSASAEEETSCRYETGCTEFLHTTLNAFFKEEGIEHQTSTARTPEQNGVVKRRNRTLVEATRTMLSASQLPLFFRTEAIAIACYA